LGIRYALLSAAYFSIRTLAVYTTVIDILISCAYAIAAYFCHGLLHAHAIGTVPAGWAATIDTTFPRLL